MDLKFSEDKEGWFIEGMVGKLDHFSAGKTKDEALCNFYGTFYATLKAHMETHGNLKQIFP